MDQYIFVVVVVWEEHYSSALFGPTCSVRFKTAQLIPTFFSIHVLNQFRNKKRVRQMETK